MKKLKYILAGLSMMLALNTNAQILDLYSSLNYGISVPTGETADYIGNTSFRGFSFEFGRFMNDDVTLGLLLSWNVFYEEFDRDTYEFDQVTITGKKFHYINAYPLMVTGRYYFLRGGIFRPYLGAGTGAYIINRTTDMGLYRNQNKNWHIGICPEAGAILELGREAHFNLGLRYNHAFKAGGDSHSWLGISTGVTFIY
jgi:opacity protein-like surface antigen